MTDHRIGLIGTGIMGEPMGHNLLKAGYELHVFSRTQAKAKALLAAGAAWQEAPAAVADATDLIISMVNDSPDVEQIYLGEHGLCQAIRPGMLCVDMSTISPDVARTVDASIRQRDGAFLDAPVSGGGNGAKAGTLSIMVGGDATDVERARPVFAAVGKSVVHCGPVGNGQLTKLCNQILCGLNLLAVSEAIVFAKQVGLDPEVMLNAVSTGAAGSWALDNLGTRMLDRDFAPMFMVDLQQKDLHIVLGTARRETIPLPGTALVTQLLAANQAAGEGREGTQALLKTLERLGNAR